jgi:putative ABC transport system permease protein
MSILSISLKNLIRRPSRTVSAIIGVLIATAQCVAILGFLDGFEVAFEGKYAARGTHLTISRISHRSPTTSAFDERWAAEIARIPGVGAVAGITWDAYRFDGKRITGVTGWPPGCFLWDHLTFVEGSGPSDGPCDDQVYLGFLAASLLGKKTGDTLTYETNALERRTLRVGGIFESPSPVENGMAIVPLASLQSILGLDGKINMINARFAPGTDPAALAAIPGLIEKRFRGLKAVKTEALAENEPGFQVARAFAVAVSAVGMAVAGLGILNTMTMSLFERRQEIGIISALGWRKSNVIAMIVIESLLMSAIGAVGGLCAGVAGAKLLEHAANFGDRISPGFDAGTLGIVLLCSLIVGSIGGCWPAWQTGKMRPTETLRDL